MRPAGDTDRQSTGSHRLFDLDFFFRTFFRAKFADTEKEYESFEAEYHYEMYRNPKIRAFFGEYQDRNLLFRRWPFHTAPVDRTLYPKCCTLPLSGDSSQSPPDTSGPLYPVTQLHSDSSRLQSPSFPSRWHVPATGMPVSYTHLAYSLGCEFSEGTIRNRPEVLSS